MASGRNPYHYGTPALDEHFTGRNDELAALVSRLRDGINVVVVSPRRYGKTSLILRAEHEIERDHAAVVHVNVLRCGDLDTLAAQLASQAFAVPGGAWRRGADAIKEFLKRFRVTPTLTVEGDVPRLLFEARLAESDAESVIEDVYRVLAETAERRPAVLVLDEFQAVVDIAPRLPKLLKALADAHSNVSLVVAGSKQHLMNALIASPDAALYGMAERFALQPLPDDVMAAYLRKRARAGGKSMSEEVARLVIDLARPAPNDIQRLAYEAFGAAGERMDEAAVRTGMQRAVAHEAATYAERVERLSVGQRRVLAALAHEPVEQPHAAQFVARTRLANASSVRKALDVLEADELVARRGGAVVVADPFFAAWLRGA